MKREFLVVTLKTQFFGVTTNVGTLNGIRDTPEGTWNGPLENFSSGAVEFKLNQMTAPY